jgi:hypothetical protein
MVDSRLLRISFSGDFSIWDYHRIMRLELEIDSRKILGPCLLLVGWIIIIVAVVIFSSLGGRAVFVILGLLVELVGIVFFVRSRNHSAGARS